MDTDEHTASTILVIQIVTKIKERTLSIPYWSFGCLQTTWITVGAVFIFIFFPTQNRWGLQVRFCHMDIEWCYFFFVFVFEDEWQVPWEHGPDPLTGPFCACLWILRLDDQPQEQRLENRGWVLFLKNGVRGGGLHNPRGNWKWGGGVGHRLSAPFFTSTLTSTRALPTHRLTYALLFIQAVRYHFGDGSTNRHGRIATTFDKVTEKIFPKLKWETQGARLLPPPVCT